MASCDSRPRPVRSGNARALGLGALVLAACVLAVVGTVALLDARVGAPVRARSAPTDRAAVHPSATTRALAVLEEWDARRAAAYARGSPSRLRELYVAGSAAGVADVRLLSRYRARDLRVDLSTQVLSLRVLERRPGRWRLAVTDRLAHAEARPVRGAHGAPVALPRDQPTACVVTLVRAGGSWRVLSVRQA